MPKPLDDEEFFDEGCKMLIAGSYCGKPETAEVHQNEWGHIYQADPS